MLLLLDNCEHLLDACGTMVVELLAACPHLTILATSREPLGVPGELSWRVPSLSLADEAIELFADRARRARPDFVVDEDNTRAGRKRSARAWMACRWRSSLPQHGFGRCRCPRSSTACMTGSGLLTGRRAHRGAPPADAARLGGLVACAAHRARTGPVPPPGGIRRRVRSRRRPGRRRQQRGRRRYQLLDQLSLLVDKSLVVASKRAPTRAGMRYRLLETVRQYAQEKLGESGEADDVRTRHRDYYTATAADLRIAAGRRTTTLMRLGAKPRSTTCGPRSRGAGRIPTLETALRLSVVVAAVLVDAAAASGKALAGFDAILTDERSARRVAPAVWVRAVADHSTLAGWVAVPANLDRAQEALAVARELDDPALIARAARSACGMLSLLQRRGGRALLRRGDRSGPRGR